MRSPDRSRGFRGEEDNRFRRDEHQGQSSWGRRGEGGYGSEGYGLEDPRYRQFERGDYEDEGRWGSFRSGRSDWGGEEYRREGGERDFGSERRGEGRSFEGRAEDAGGRGWGLEDQRYGGGGGGSPSGWGRAGEGYGGHAGDYRGAARGGPRGYGRPQPRYSDQYSGAEGGEWGSSPALGGYDERRGAGLGRSYSQGGFSRSGWEGRSGEADWGGRAGGRREEDSRGRFFGKSPQGYTRSDERIREEVCDRFMQGEFDPSEVNVKVEKGEVTLEGSVESRHTKYRAEEIAESILGVKDVNNNLKIKRPNQGDSQQESSSQREDETSSRFAKRTLTGTASTGSSPSTHGSRTER